MVCTIAVNWNFKDISYSWEEYRYSSQLEEILLFHLSKSIVTFCQKWVYGLVPERTSIDYWWTPLGKLSRLITVGDHKQRLATSHAFHPVSVLLCVSRDVVRDVKCWSQIYWLQINAQFTQNKNKEVEKNEICLIAPSLNCWTSVFLCTIRSLIAAVIRDGCLLCFI